MMPPGQTGGSLRSAADWVRDLGLIPHPEGGHYWEVYRSAELVPLVGLPSRYPGPRPFVTSIYFLLRSGEISAFHRLRSDEIWNFYQGSPLVLTIISPSGELDQVRLGPQNEAGEVWQTVVSAGHWFGAIVLEPDSFSLVGCAVAPGFDFADFELGRRSNLLRLFPQHKSSIMKLTR
jgi:predicted cupin superfamily sugar epimerase